MSNFIKIKYLKIQTFEKIMVNWQTNEKQHVITKTGFSIKVWWDKNEQGEKSLQCYFVRVCYIPLVQGHEIGFSSHIYIL